MNNNTLKQVHTRFRAYSLGNEGASYSIFINNHFTLIEARATEKSIPRIAAELRACVKERIDCLHITSWDKDHCKLDELMYIVITWKPRHIEYPGYAPETENALRCHALIAKYQSQQATAGTPITTRAVTPQYITSLNTAQKLGYRDVVYHPRALFEESNNNSTVKMFREGAFTIASMGDVEHENIGAFLRRDSIFSTELDLLIVPHHGAENPILTPAFMKATQPALAVCSNDYDDKFDHPDESVKDLFAEFGVELLCTKTGDVIVESIAPHATRFQGWNICGTQVHYKGPYVAKKARLLQHNQDTIRNHYLPSSRPVIRR
jgi:competence protein ComEC